MARNDKDKNPKNDEPLEKKLWKIADKFISWISPPFKLYLKKEFQRLKDEERKQLGWDIRRNLTKINYRIHTDAIKENLNALFINDDSPGCADE